MEVKGINVLMLSVAGTLIGVVLIAVLGFIVGKFFFRPMIQRRFGLVMNRLLQDLYQENLMELLSAVKRTSFLNIVELSLRAENGCVIRRPMGSSKRFPGFDGLMFIPAQMTSPPKESDVAVDMSVRLGPKATEPLMLDIPLMISGMGYGVSLSEEAKLALARGAKNAGTAICSGDGPFLPEEYEEAGKYIWQVSRGSWGRNAEALALADMIEVQMGQGAKVGSYRIDPYEIKGKARKLMGLSPVEEAVAHAVTPGIKSPRDWPRYVRELRQAAEGKPIALKLMAGGRLEEDLAVALKSGFDVIVLDGAQAGTHGSSPLLEDDFGLPSLQALMRAVRYLCEQGARKEVSLVVGGGYFTPGECLKALALGADAIYLGTLPLFALTHRQLGEVMPWEPLGTLVSYNSVYSKRLDIDIAAENVTNLLKSMTLEMEEGIRALGKSSLAEVGYHDLIALDQWTAEITGVQRA